MSAATVPGRAREIAVALAPVAHRWALGVGRRFGLGREDHDTAAHAEALRAALEGLGPVFVKLGQMLSTRPDLVAPSTMAALQRLQSKVAPMCAVDVDRALAEHREELGRDVFARFEHVPLASASLAQVHRAELHDGRAVAVKILRRDVTARMELDFLVLDLLARAAERWIDADVYDLRTTVEELFQALREESDLRREAENLAVFARNLSAWSPALRVPAVYEELTTSSVLVMELIEGAPLGDGGAARIPGERRAELARSLAHAYFQMFFVDGSFHADPHPGNILVEPDGGLVLLDFGMVGRIERQVSDNLVRVLLNFQLRDSHGVAHAFLDIGKPTARADEIGWIMDVRRLLPRYHGMRLERLNVGTLLVDLLANATKNGIQVPPVVALVCKSLANMDGSARMIDPSIDLVSTFAAFLPALLEAHARRVASVQDAVKMALDVYIGSQRVPFQIATILEKAATGRLRLVVDPVRR
ncbi:MAG: AarF/ABC1/UbiB kinase family protein [Myxococcales bacterium]|nr:AarF/ABC1/UbiB kinase family protein [Myxococcales bacterium]